jgi:site-specific DNA-methyltransferase (adenine-specific)
MQLDTILNCDCLEGMKNIPDGTIDAVICDLPYGTTRNQWDSVIPLDKLWAEYRRICKPTAPIVLFSQQPFTTILAASNLEWFKYEWIWEKENGSNFLNAKFVPLKIHENILVFYKESPTYNPQMRTGFEPYRCRDKGSNANYGKINGGVLSESNGERYPIDIIYHQRDADSFHPTQKPVDLLRYLVLTYTNEGDTVLDNCIGSGTTAVACIKEKRHFIGFELNEDYYKKACDRIWNEQRQLKLF